MYWERVSVLKRISTPPLVFISSAVLLQLSCEADSQAVLLKSALLPHTSLHLYQLSDCTGAVETPKDKSTKEKDLVRLWSRMLRHFLCPLFLRVVQIMYPICSSSSRYLQALRWSGFLQNSFSCICVGPVSCCCVCACV